MEKETAIEAVKETVPARPDELGVSVEHLLARVSKIREVQSRVMKEGHHYGKIPGVDKPTLLKPGAEILCLTFQLDPQFQLEERTDGSHLEVVATCTLYHAPTGTRLGSGVGSCSTKESKYAYRKAERECPKCGAAAIIKGKEEYGGGWLCWNKRGGCGAKFRDGDKSIEGQQTDRVENPDIPDQYNTVRKMACKRAHVAAVLFTTCASDLFTQDVEEFPQNGNGSSREPTPIETNIDQVIDELESARTLEELDQIRAEHTERKWTRGQRTKLANAYTARQEALRDNPQSAAEEAF